MELLAVLLFAALPLYMIFYPLVLRGRITSLERRLEQLERNGVTTAVSSKSPKSAKSSKATVAEESDSQDATPELQERDPEFAAGLAQAGAPNPLMTWLKEDFLMKLGAFLLLLAVMWFVSYAFENNWVGPAGRIALGILFGTALMAAGTWRIRSFVHQGGVLIALGGTTVLLTIFAARMVYDFFTPTTSLAMMFMVVVFTAFVSVMYKSKALAIGGLVMAGVAPMLTGAEPSVLGMNLYLLVVVAGTLWLVFTTRWSELTFIAMIITYLYNIPYLEVLNSRVAITEIDLALMFSLIFVAIYFVTNVASMRFFGSKEHTQSHVAAVVGTGIYLFTWVIGSVDPEWQSLMYVAWALVFTVGSYLVYLMSAHRAVFYLYSAIGVALIGAATAAELDGNVLTIAFTLEIGLLLAAATALRMPIQIISRLTLLLAVPLFMSLPSMDSSSWNTGIVHSDFAVLLIVTLMFFSVGVFLRDQNDSNDNDIDFISSVLLIVGTIFATILTWLTLHAVMEETLATTMTLVVYTVTGITCLIKGQRDDHKGLRFVGGAFIAIVVGRLLLVEVWDMPLIGRVITFFIIGGLLVSTAFMGKLLHKRDDITEVTTENHE